MQQGSAEASLTPFTRNAEALKPFSRDKGEPSSSNQLAEASRENSL